MHDYCSRCFVPPIQQFKLTAQREGGIKGSKRFPIDWILFLPHISESLSYFSTSQIAMTNYCRNPITSEQWSQDEIGIVTCIDHYYKAQVMSHVTRDRYTFVWQGGALTPHGHNLHCMGGLCNIVCRCNDHHCSKPCKYQTFVASLMYIDMAFTVSKTINIILQKLVSQ